MKTTAQYIYRHKNGSFHVLYVCNDSNVLTRYFTTDNGAFGQRDMRVVEMSPVEAEQIIADTTETGREAGSDGAA